MQNYNVMLINFNNCKDIKKDNKSTRQQDNKFFLINSSSHEINLSPSAPLRELVITRQDAKIAK